FITLSQMTLFSPSGRCFTFDGRADGTVMGEAVAAVMLKPLERALADGDHIYGVIRGWGMNQDGRTNGLTAPSARSQARLQTDVYRRFGIDPAHIGMVEAHGTGTKLGDPIEVRALQESFRSFTDRNGYCALGSLKSNIGHAFFGAGIASVVKVVQALRHGEIPPTLNFQELNPAIRLEDSPFYINTELRPWAADDGHPRCAAINALGASGVNAHVVIEEPPAIPPRQTSPDRPCAMVLSARSKDRLRASVERLRDWCAGEAASACAPCDVAYTLQTGREPMAFRLAVVVTTLAELGAQLESYLADEANADLFLGRLSPSATQRARTAEDLADRVEAALAASGAAALAALWVEGADVDWARLYACDRGQGPRRVSLPTYPFASERAWVEPAVRADPPAPAQLHPLLHANTSNLSEHSFASRFSGEEFFLRDHRIQDERVLPGVAYLEMARAAIEQAWSGDTACAGLRIENVVWMQPYVHGPHNDTLRIAIAPIASADPAEPARLEFEIYSGEPDAEAVIRYCQGEAVRLAQDSPRVDLDQVRARCQAGDVLGSELYPALCAAGFGLGPGQQGVVAIHRGEGEVLGRLAVPAAASGTFGLHPAILDSALHCVAGLAADASSDFPLALPFALETLDVHAPCNGERWAWVRYSPGSAATDALVRMDIDICDADGAVCARLQRFSSRPLVKAIAPTAVAPAATPIVARNTYLLRPHWREEAPQPGPVAADAPRRHVLYCGTHAPRRIAALRAAGADEVTEILVDPAERLDTGYSQAAIAVLEALKAELTSLAAKGAARSRRLVQLVLDSQAVSRHLDGLSALLKSANKENGRLAAQTVQMLDEATPAELCERLAQEAASPTSREVRYVAGTRWLLCTEECGRLAAPDADAAGRQVWRADGLYVVTGGAGGLGLIVARDILSRAPGAKVRLIGRSALKEETRTLLESLRAAGHDVSYHRADVMDRVAMERVRAECLTEHGSVTGLIHTAGLLSDSYIFRKDLGAVGRVLGPKVTGLAVLDEVFAHDDLDLFVAFSSFAGEFGNPGQSDYAAANAFMDSYLRRRAQLVRHGARSGRTVAIGWPLWRDGGMSVDAAYEEMMARTDGVYPLATELGLAALDRILAGDDAHVLVLHGEERAIQASCARPVLKQVVPAVSGPAGEGRRLRRRLMGHVGRRIAELIRIDPSRIEPDAELGEFGLDSISLTQLCNNLNREFKLKLSPTIFFEFTTLRDFTEHLADRFPDSLAPVLDRGADGAAPAGSPPAARHGRTSPRRVRGGYRQDGPTKTAATVPPSAAATPGLEEPIAIVGLSARFPLADDANALWRNLLAGRDCIREVPADRWDWREIWGDPLEEPGRTRVKWGGFMDGIGDFDPSFFSISPREAETMDPQQRLLMIHVWKAIEDAGYAPSELAGSNTALYIATHDSGYYELFEKAGLPSNGSEIPTSMAPNRMSYFLDLHGPSEPVETACSSSLVAIHRGVGALRAGHTDLAIVGGVETICTPTKHINFSRNGLLSEDGRCKTFSAQANGYVRGEGVGMLVLKRLADAERDRDSIRGVILATSENHGGRANSLTAPNPSAQANVLRTAYRAAGVDPRSVGYIEAHGTGTALGDPVEVDGLKAAFRDLYDETRASTAIDLSGAVAHCVVGS
ncbi:MAG TPA: type I polyketide synthase, partial [Phenylobacterium sp.]|uniref:type I polyketide synthase n=1 Tax=Phenylobacterium sp. TaxID=1871053 RepID=UPI002D421D31